MYACMLGRKRGRLVGCLEWFQLTLATLPLPSSYSPLRSPAGPGYQIRFYNTSNISDIYATSDVFVLLPVNSSSDATATTGIMSASTASVTGSATAGASTVTAAIPTNATNHLRTCSFLFLFCFLSFSASPKSERLAFPLRPRSPSQSNSQIDRLVLELELELDRRSSTKQPPTGRWRSVRLCRGRRLGRSLALSEELCGLSCEL